YTTLFRSQFLRGSASAAGKRIGPRGGWTSVFSRLAVRQEADGEGAADAFGAAYFHGPIVGFHNLLHDGQAQPDAVCFLMRHRGFAAEKPLEDELELFGRNPKTFIGHLQERLAA